MYVVNLGMGVMKVSSSGHTDARGSLTEVFRRDALESVNGPAFDWKQSNLSVNNRGVFRGIHFSTAPEGQAKYLTCISGALYDFAVDLRRGSETFGQVVTTPLVFGESVYIPKGFGHGFVTVANYTVVTYLLSSHHNPETEHTVSWRGLVDPLMYAQGNGYTGDLVVSKRDNQAANLTDHVAQGGALPE